VASEALPFFISVLPPHPDILISRRVAAAQHARNVERIEKADISDHGHETSDSL
jgi:hypothetical protein